VPCGDGSISASRSSARSSPTALRSPSSRRTAAGPRDRSLSPSPTAPPGQPRKHLLNATRRLGFPAPVDAARPALGDRRIELHATRERSRTTRQARLPHAAVGRRLSPATPVLADSSVPTQPQPPPGPISRAAPVEPPTSDGEVGDDVAARVTPHNNPARGRENGRHGDAERHGGKHPNDHEQQYEPRTEGQQARGRRPRRSDRRDVHLASTSPHTGGKARNGAPARIPPICREIFTVYRRAYPPFVGRSTTENRGVASSISGPRHLPAAAHRLAASSVARVRSTRRSLRPCQAGASLGRWRGLRPRHPRRLPGRDGRADDRRRFPSIGAPPERQGPNLGTTRRLEAAASCGPGSCAAPDPSRYGARSARLVCCSTRT
jgi:hypothetical protein